MMTMIKDRISNLIKSIPKNVTLVAVSKTKPVSAIKEAYEGGQRIFGENKIQEMVSKYEALPTDIEWHMIGHLQSNKVKYMAHFVSLIHGVDSLKTLKEINKQAKKHDRTIRCLLQARIAKEETKFGMTFGEIKMLFKSKELVDLKNIKIVGLMGMATFTEDTNQLNLEFSNLSTLFTSLKDAYQLTELSMGMSGDYKIAIENGSTMIRVGSAIFGERNYIA